MNKAEMKWPALAVLAAACAVLAAAPASAQKQYDPGASDSEIRIGQTMPFSGPVSIAVRRSQNNGLVPCGDGLAHWQSVVGRITPTGPRICAVRWA